MKFWELANYCWSTYGVLINEEDGFFECPICGEPIYQDDWDGSDLITDGFCPVCEEFIAGEE